MVSESSFLIEKSQWSFVLLCCGLLLMMGLLADKMWGWLWIHNLSKYLNKKASHYLDKYFIPIAHSNIQNVSSKLEHIFGKKFFNKKIVLISFLPALLIALTAQLAESIIRDVPISIGSSIMIFIMCLVNIPLGCLSLWTTKFILKRVKPKVTNLLGLLTLDLLIAYALCPIAFWVGLLIVLPEQASILEMLKATGYMIAYWPENHINRFKELEILSDYLNFIAFTFLYFAAIIPSIIHLKVLTKDVFRFCILRWLYLGLAGVFSYLAETKKPMAVLLTAIASLIPLSKLFMDSLPFIKDFF
jgi:hypothetical protein